MKLNMQIVPEIAVPFFISLAIKLTFVSEKYCNLSIEHNLIVRHTHCERDGLAQVDELAKYRKGKSFGVNPRVSTAYSACTSTRVAATIVSHLMSGKVIMKNFQWNGIGESSRDQTCVILIADFYPPPTACKR